ncbi:hypothetical protein [Ovoidimarina sediminis]|uniref:hypothetical protein n=1 Tax=Ovoidimarina sediminis TaxID=3079856 RepID=UPI0029113996|nr:hypothetical protein [Rhodophyticola sp. MJ-SS7]MDU8946770.1 hypothetical protein [Rhodophyticola sp. MJ-SS7]
MAETLTDKLLLNRWFKTAMGEDYVEWAVQLLLRGEDSPSLRVLAGLNPNLERYEVEPNFLETCDELNIRPLPPDCNPRSVVPLIRRLHRSNLMSAKEALDKMSELYEASEFSDPLLGLWFMVRDDYAPELGEEIDRWVEDAWPFYDRAQVLELPQDFPKFVGCDHCGHIGMPVPWNKLNPPIKSPIGADARPKETVMPYVCAVCNTCPARHIGHFGILEKYLSRFNS